MELDDLLSKVRLMCHRYMYTDPIIPCFTQLEEINEQLGALASNPELMSASMLRAVQRHRELYLDNARELKRTKVAYSPLFCFHPVLMLFCFCRRMLSRPLTKPISFLASGTTSSMLKPHFLQNQWLILFSAYKSSAADSLLAERGRIDSSHQMTDTIIEYVKFCAMPLYLLTDWLLQTSVRDSVGVFTAENFTSWYQQPYGTSHWYVSPCTSLPFFVPTHGLLQEQCLASTIWYP